MKTLESSMKLSEAIRQIISEPVGELHGLPLENSVPEKAKLTTYPFDRFHFCLSGQFDLKIFVDGEAQVLPLRASDMLFVPAHQYIYPTFERDYHIVSYRFGPGQLTLLHETFIDGEKQNDEITISLNNHDFETEELQHHLHSHHYLH